MGFRECCNKLQGSYSFECIKFHDFCLPFPGLFHAFNDRNLNSYVLICEIDQYYCLKNFLHFLLLKNHFPIIFHDFPALQKCHEIPWLSRFSNTRSNPELCTVSQRSQFNSVHNSQSMDNAIAQGTCSVVTTLREIYKSHKCYMYKISIEILDLKNYCSLSYSGMYKYQSRIMQEIHI